IPFWTSSLIRTYALIIMLKANGLLNSLLLFTGIINQPLEILYTDLAVYIGLVYTLLPFMVMPLYAALEKIDQKLIEAAVDLGAGSMQVFTPVPAGYHCRVHHGVSALRGPVLHSGPAGGRQVHAHRQLHQEPVPDRCQLALRLVGLGSAHGHDAGPDRLLFQDHEAVQYPAPGPGTMKRFIGRSYLTLVYLCLYLPVAVLIVYSFNSAKYSTAWKGASLKWYMSLMHTRAGSSPWARAGTQTCPLISPTWRRSKSASAGSNPPWNR
ncbi:MAG: hypothetical protein V1751_11360, partial [Pseudomonadota bacterium]